MATTNIVNANVTVKFVVNEKGNPSGKLADAELHFNDGVFAGLKLIGFTVWERRSGGGRNVTFPARTYSVNGERRSFSLLRPAAGDATAQDRVREMILESSPDGVVAALGAMRERPDSTDLLGEIKVPTLLIGGAEDVLSTPEIMQEMAKKIPNSHHLTLKAAGHLSNLEAPEEFNGALLKFLKEV